MTPMVIWLVVRAGVRMVLRGREPLAAIRLLAVGVTMVAVVVRPKRRGGILAVVVGPGWTLDYLATLCPGMIATEVAVVGVWKKRRRQWYLALV